MSLDQIRKEIENIKDSECRFYSYLYDLTYNEISKNIHFLETIYLSFLKDERTEIKRESLFLNMFSKTNM